MHLVGELFMPLAVAQAPGFGSLGWIISPFHEPAHRILPIPRAPQALKLSVVVPL